MMSKILPLLMILISPNVSKTKRSANSKFSFPQKSSFVFHSVHSTSNPTYLKDFKASVFNNSAGASCFNLSTEVRLDIQRVMASFEVKVFKEPGVASNFFQTNFDACSVAKGTIGNFLVKALLKDHEKYSNYRYGCPQKKGFFYFHNFPVPRDDILPPFVQKLYVPWELIVRGKGKNATTAFVPMFLISLKGETARD